VVQVQWCREVSAEKDGAKICKKMVRCRGECCLMLPCEATARRAMMRDAGYCQTITTVVHPRWRRCHYDERAMINVW